MLDANGLEEIKEEDRRNRESNDLGVKSELGECDTESEQDPSYGRANAITSTHVRANHIQYQLKSSVHYEE